MDPSIVALFVLLAAACATDVHARKIPNTLIAFGLCLGFGLNYSAMGQSSLWFSLQGVATGFAIFFPLFLLRAFGAGDVKLFMVIGSLIGPGDTLVLAMLALVAGGVLALLASIAKRRFPGMMYNMKATIFALASRDFELASSLAQETSYRVPFAIPVLAGAIAWLVYFY